MSTLGPWQPASTEAGKLLGYQRLTPDGASAAIVRTPNDSDPIGTWGWFAINVGNLSDGGQAPNETEAKRIADETAIKFGHVIHNGGA